MGKKWRNRKPGVGVVNARPLPVVNGNFTKVEHFSGPLPHPDTLARYDQIVPGAANRIVTKFEAQTEHRMRIEKIVVWAGSIKEVAGVFLGFIIAVLTISGGIYTALKGQPFLGGSLSFAGLALIVGAFVTAKYGKKE